MPSPYSCDLNGLLVSSTCFSDKCMSDSDRKAVMIYARILNLAALGGTDYSSNLKQLMIDSAKWRKKSADELNQISTLLALQNAAADGANVPGSGSLNLIWAAIKCLKEKCLGTANQNGVLSYLGCAITSQNKPE